MQAQAAVSPAQVKTQIEAALRRMVEVNARQISVATSNSPVVLGGKVHSWFERHEVEAAAWKAPGVTAVENHFAVVP
jgi:osmotically-inducible protein OsmY